MNRSRRVVVAAGIAVVAFAGCQSSQPAPVACSPDATSWPEAFDLTGTYTVTMTPMVDDMAGEPTTGTITLRAVDDMGDGPSSGYRLGYYGSANIDLEAVGAIELGTLQSDDPDMPGVVVQLHRSGAHVDMLVRFGSEANRTDRTRFDGGYTVLRVSSLTEGGATMSGTWTSGVSRTDASGSFCAVKTAE